MPDYLPAWFILAIIAPAVGSFLGVLVVRLPQGRAFVFGRSRCENCQRVLAPADLVPLASWLWLGGKCRYCRARIETLYPAIELSALGIVIWAATITSGQVLIASCVFGWVLLALLLTDWRNYFLPDQLTLFLLLGGLVAGFIITPTNILDHVAGAGLGFLGLAVLAWAYRVLRGREGLGFGDAKLLAGIGAWVTFQGLGTVIFFAALLALAGVLVGSLSGRKFSATSRVPFGSFLAAAGWLVWLYGPLTLR